MGRLVLGGVLLVAAFFLMVARAGMGARVLHDLRSSSNVVLLVPTEGGLPLLDIGALRKNLKER